MGRRIGSLFSGAGGLDLAVLEVFGGDVAWHAEIDKAASKVLAYRFPGVPNLGDISAVDWADVPAVDVLCGGFPCQDVSAAGKRAGIKAGTRSGLWSVFADAIDELRPQWVVIENVRGLLSATAHRTVDDADSDVEPAAGVMGDGAGRPVLRAAGAVLGDLADLGYDAQWATVAAADVGAPHRRERVFILATHTAIGSRDGLQQQDLSALQQRRGDRRPRKSGVCDCGNTSCGTDASDSARNGRDEGRPEPARLVGGFDAAVSGDEPGVALLPTPGTMDDREKRTTHAGGNLTLQGAVVGVNPVDVERHSRAGRTVAADDGVALLPTPCAQQSGNSPEEHLRKKPGRKVVTDLAILVENGLMETGGALPPTGERTVADGRQACGCGDRRIDHDWFANPDRFDDGGCRRCRCEGFWPSADEPGVALLPTPNASDGSGGGQHPDKREGHSRQLIDYVLAPSQWGKYAPAVARWEQITGPAPAPTEPNKNGNPRLSAAFSEWLMGWPHYWVTHPDIGISRNDQLRIVGNGVCPQQAAAALRYLLAIWEVTA